MVGNPSKPAMGKLESLIESLYEFVESNRKERYAVYGITLLLVLIYALFSKLIIGRPLQNVAIECAIITVVLILTLSLTSISLTSNEKRHLIPLGFGFAFMSLIILFSTGIYYLTTIEKLKDNVSDSRDEIQDSKKKILQFTEHPFLSAGYREGETQLTILLHQSGTIEDTLKIVLLDIKNPDDMRLAEISIQVSSPKDPTQTMLFKGEGDAKMYFGRENFEIKLLKANTRYARLLVTQKTNVTP